jgi:hypothetical protein
MWSYKPEESFDETGRLRSQIAAAAAAETSSSCGDHVASRRMEVQPAGRERAAFTFFKGDPRAVGIAIVAMPTASMPMVAHSTAPVPPPVRSARVRLPEAAMVGGHDVYGAGPFAGLDGKL